VSPSEFDLRAALRAGEGEHLDPDSVLSAARSARHQRRVRIASAVGAAAVVGAVGAGVGIVDLHSPASPAASGSSTTSSGSAASSGSHSLLYGSGAPGPVQTALAALTCPATATRYMLPGGGGTGQFGGKTSLFGRPVAAMKVCVYPAAAGTTPARSYVIEGADARAAAQSLDAAPKVPLFCQRLVPETQLTFEVLAVTADGTKLRPVVVSGRVTNGTAVRYTCEAPISLTRQLPGTPTN
jgi:hypothetical protein